MKTKINAKIKIKRINMKQKLITKHNLIKIRKTIKQKTKLKIRHTINYEIRLITKHKKKCKTTLKYEQYLNINTTLN